ncbi:MAG: hypothetical protein ABI878_02660 [Acidobacteriota bacterium]
MITQNSMIETLKDFVRRLDELGIKYMITGSFAMHAYATGRLTYDIDAIIEISSRDAGRFESRFLPDYYVDEISIRNAVERSSMFNVLNLRNGVKVDCIVRKATAIEAEKFERRRKAEIEEVGFWVISKEDLILSKLEWAKESLSEKQFLDIRSLVESGIEETLFLEKVRRLNLSEVWEEFEKWKIQAEK